MIIMSNWLQPSWQNTSLIHGINSPWRWMLAVQYFSDESGRHYVKYPPVKPGHMASWQKNSKPVLALLDKHAAAIHCQLSFPVTELWLLMIWEDTRAKQTAS